MIPIDEQLYSKFLKTLKKGDVLLLKDNDEQYFFLVKDKSAQFYNHVSLNVVHLNRTPPASGWLEINFYIKYFHLNINNKLEKTFRDLKEVKIFT